MKTTLRKGHEREYGAWQAMKTRCYNKNHIHYDRYGGRGIRVCDRWLGEHGFENFYNDMYPKPSNTTLDRIDCDKDYSPENCRWATWTEQANNRKNNVVIVFDGKSMPVSQWAKELNISVNTLKTRLRRKMPLEKALSGKKYRRTSS